MFLVYLNIAMHESGLSVFDFPYKSFDFCRTRSITTILHKSFSQGGAGSFYKTYSAPAVR